MAGQDAQQSHDQPPKPGLREALTAFRYRNFALFWLFADERGVRVPDA